MTKLRTAALTDVGHLRLQNEDRFILDDASSLYAVADGVGGLPGGAQAAQLAVDEIGRAIRSGGKNGKLDLEAIALQANHSVADLGIQLSPGIGIGTTLTFCVIRDGKLHLAHVGDSRCYVWHAGTMELLTLDHSVENDARLRRSRGEMVYFHQANRNALTRCIGQPIPPEVDQLTRTLRAGERYLLCSDGITRLIREAELAEMLGQDTEPAKLVQELIELANRRGGPDNSTAVVIAVDEA